MVGPAEVIEQRLHVQYLRARVQAGGVSLQGRLIKQAAKLARMLRDLR